MALRVIGPLHTRAARSAVLAAMLLAACSSDSLGPLGNAAVGNYVLVSVDGQALPAPLESGDCPRVVTDGVLSLSPQQGETRPLYAWDIFSELSCRPMETHDDTSMAVEVDGGGWSVVAGSIRTASSARGSYTMQLVAGNGGRPDITFAMAGHSYRWRYANDGLGADVVPLTVSITDSAGQPVGGAWLRFIRPNEVVLRGGTREDGIFIAPLVPGKTLIRIAPPPGYVLASSGPYPIPVNMVGAQPDSIQIILADTGASSGKAPGPAHVCRGSPGC